MRIFYSRTSDTVIYLRQTHAAVNEYFENLITQTDSTRWRVSLDRTDVQDLHSRSALRLYPNPNKGQFTLEFPADNSKAYFRILHLNGQTIYQGQIHNNSLGREELDLNGLIESGLYLLEYQSQRGRNWIRFLIHD
jgi:hypothetical protein